MKITDSHRPTTQEKTAGNTQINIIVDGYKVKLNFPPKSESTAINDIKRMMLGGLGKT
jgi:hypothetical protein